MAQEGHGFKKHTEANRAAWNEVVPRHQAAAKAMWDREFMKPGFVCLDKDEVALLERIGIKGKNVAHLCCNNGVELLSLKNLGAGECIGFDISDLAVQEAAERADRCRIGCRFVRSDVYEIGPEFEGRFDLVYISAGSLGWIPYLGRFFAKAASLLSGEGQVFIHEIHPFTEMLPVDDCGDDGVLRIVAPYFRAEPDVAYGGLDYVGRTRYVSALPQYWFVHTLSEILTSLSAGGMSLEHFSEHERDISSVHRRIEEARAGVPLSYILVGRKTASPIRGRPAGETDST